ncbi:MAG: LysR family transcriptional regulator [Hyphomonadaceae bacterium]
MPFDLRHLRAFEYLAEELHFGRAAQRANTSQSALSHQIQRLEDIVGARLFDRNRRSVRLTEAGQAFREGGKDILSRAEALKIRVQAEGRQSRHVLKIGYTNLALQTPMSHIFHQMKDMHPGVEIELHELWGANLEHALLAGELHCGFSACTEDVRFSRLEIGVAPLLACLPSGHALASREFVTFEDFEDEPIFFIPEDRAPNVFRAIASAFERAGVAPHFMELVEGPSTALALAASGSGIGFVTSSLAGLAPPGVALRPVGNPPFSLPISLIWRARESEESVAHIVAIARGLGVPQPSCP